MISDIFVQYKDGGYENCFVGEEMYFGTAEEQKLESITLGIDMIILRAANGVKRLIPYTAVKNIDYKEVE